MATPTLNNYLTYAEKTNVIDLVRPFFSNPTKELSKVPMPYFIDLVLRNLLLGHFGSLSEPHEPSLH